MKLDEVKLKESTMYSSFVSVFVRGKRFVKAAKAIAPDKIATYTFVDEYDTYQVILTDTFSKAADWATKNYCQQKTLPSCMLYVVDK